MYVVPKFSYKYLRNLTISANIQCSLFSVELNDLMRCPQLEHKSEEARHLESKVAGFEEKLKASEENAETYVEKLKQLQELHQQQADQHRNEMAAQSRLSNIYKIASQENDGKITELVSGF